jgi:protein-S-isoprenylcysteine O-methyltransferase Ste14
MSALELKIPPVALVLAFGAAMWWVSTSTPSLALAIPWRHGIAVALALAGLIITVTGLLAFREANTTVNPAKPDATSAMVTWGVYRLSRNPMYLGLLLVLTGWGVFLSHALAFILLPLFVGYMNRFQISPEERALSTKFGPEFAAYRQSVRRWL